MTERIVVSFWMAHEGLSPLAGRGFVDRTRSLVQRAEALGGNMIAFGAQLVALAFDPESTEEAITLAVAAMAEETRSGECAWAAGLSEGAVEAVAPDDTRGWLAWGVPLASSASLARVARRGEVLVDASFKAVNAIVTIGMRVSRERGRRVRGAILDLTQPWRHVAAALVARVRSPPLLGREDPSALLWMPGALAVLRADPGLGGTRLLSELASLVAPAPCLVLSPSGSSLEPYGALRRALARANAIAADQLEVALEPALRRLLAGDGVPIEAAAAIVGSFLRGSAEDAPPGALLIDDVIDVDPSSVEACARAVVTAAGAFACVVRVDDTTAPPAGFAQLARGPEMELKPFDDADGRAFAAAALGGALDPVARRRWARCGSHTPLGILEAISSSLSAGELAWSGEIATPRTRVAGRGPPRAAVQWIARRAQRMSSALEQLILAFVALAGGELSLDRLGKLLAAAKVRVDTAEETRKLVFRRWLVQPQPSWVALPTRSHREAILGEVGDTELRGIIHRALAHVLESEERGLGLAEAAHHLAKSGDRKNAARVALTCARTAVGLELRDAATHLVALAREQDPTCEPDARAILALVVPLRRATPSSPPGAHVSASATAPLAPHSVAVHTARDARTHDSEPPTMTIVSFGEGDEVHDDFAEDAPASVTLTVSLPIEDVPQPSSEPGAGVVVARMSTLSPPHSATEPPGTVSDPPPAMDVVPPHEDVGDRLTELAKEALMGADTQSLERWAEGLVAAGEHGRFAERMQAIVRLSRGDVGEALRALRAARAELDAGTAQGERCQTSLAIGVALAVAGRPEESLLEALDALARAREQNDEKGAHACLAFLSKLFTAMDRPEDASRLRRVARIVKETQVPASPS